MIDQFFMGQLGKWQTKKGMERIQYGQRKMMA